MRNLHALGADDELRSYAIKHDLYREAIDAYKYQPEQLRDITHLYAEYLREQSQHKDAGIGKSLPRKIRQVFLSNKLPCTNTNQLSNLFHSTMMPTNPSTLPSSGANPCTVP